MFKVDHINICSKSSFYIIIGRYFNVESYGIRASRMRDEHLSIPTGGRACVTP